MTRSLVYRCDRCDRESNRTEIVWLERGRPAKGPASTPLPGWLRFSDSERVYDICPSCVRPEDLAVGRVA